MSQNQQDRAGEQDAGGRANLGNRLFINTYLGCAYILYGCMFVAILLFVAALYCGLALGVLGCAEWLSSKWPMSGPWVYGILLLALGGILAAILRVKVRTLLALSPLTSDSPDDDEEPGPVYYRAKMLAVFVILLVPVAFAFAAGAGQFFNHWNRLYGGFSAPSNATFRDWALYGIGWLLDNLLANYGQIFGLGFSGIYPVSLAARIMVLAYNIVVEILAVGAIVRIVMIVFKGSKVK